MNHWRKFGFQIPIPIRVPAPLAISAGIALAFASVSAWATSPDDCAALLAANQASEANAPESSEAIIADAWAELLAPDGRALEAEEIDWIATLSTEKGDAFSPGDRLFDSPLRDALADLDRMADGLIDTRQIDSSRLRELILARAQTLISATQQVRQAEGEARERRATTLVPVKILDGGRARWVGERILTEDGDSLKVWNASGGLVATLQGNRNTPGNPDVYRSSDGTKILTAQKYPLTARMWDTGGNLLAALEWHDAVNDESVLSFGPDGTKVVTADSSGTARVWDLSGKLLATLSGHAQRLYSAAFSLDGSKIVTASEDGTARVWDLSGRLIATLEPGVENHSGRIDFVWVGFSPDGTRILTASRKGVARLWGLNGKQLAALEGSDPSKAYEAPWVWYSPDGRKIVTVKRDAVRVWDADGRLLAALPLEPNAVGFTHAAFSPDGSKIATANDLGDVQVWDVRGELLGTAKEPPSYHHRSGVMSASFSPDGTRIVIAYRAGTARVCDSSGNLLATLNGHQAGVYSAAFSPDGTKIVTASHDRTTRVWDLDCFLLDPDLGV